MNKDCRCTAGFQSEKLDRSDKIKLLDALMEYDRDRIVYHQGMIEYHTEKLKASKRQLDSLRNSC